MSLEEMQAGAEVSRQDARAHGGAAGGAEGGAGVPPGGTITEDRSTAKPETGTAAGPEGGADPKSNTGNPKAEPPPWRKISGLLPGAEEKMSRSERRYALRKLFKEYERRVREMLAEHASDAEKDERTFLWDPVQAACFELCIARRKLSALTKEFNGMAAHEVVDKIKGESLRAAIDAEMDVFCRKEGTPGYNSNGHAEWLDYFIAELRSQRRAAEFDRAEFSIRRGFANYARYRRGCMLAHGGKTPGQLEAESVRKISEYYALARSLRERSGKHTWQGLEWVVENEGKPWDDAWMAARKERPEWLAAMREKFGLFEKLEKWEACETVPPFEDPALREKCERERAMRARYPDPEERAAAASAEAMARSKKFKEETDAHYREIREKEEAAGIRPAAPRAPGSGGPGAPSSTKI